MKLTLDSIEKKFPGVIALGGVSFEILPGQIHALLGENGAGKSTLIKTITGLYRPDSGRLLIDDQEVRFNSPRDALAAGIGVVHQERNLITRFTVGENIMIERPPGRRGLMDFEAVHREARSYLNMIEPSISTYTEVRRLSVAQMQIVEIAKALSTQAKLLILDEPTASITEHEADALFAVLRRLKQEGKAIVFVSHRLEEVTALCDRVTVLRDGKVAVAAAPMSEMSRRKIVEAMIGREERSAEIGIRPAFEKPVLEVRGVSTALGHVDINLTLRKGEILGLYGLVGAGRTELARALIGDAKITAGEVRLRGAAVSIPDVATAVRTHRIGYVSEDRKSEGLILAHPIRSNIAITVWRRLGSRLLGLFGRRREVETVTPLAKKLEIKTPSLEQTVGNLSGGNQQKVSIAKWLAAGVDILIVDEPTVGIDVGTKTAIHELIAEVTHEGVSVLLISSDMPEMIALADRVLVMHDFAVVGEIKNSRRYESASQEIMHFIHGAQQDGGSNPIWATASE
jgi:ribose transport system ATP-binding protein